MAAHDSEKTQREMILSLFQTHKEVVVPFIERTDKALNDISTKDYLTVGEAKEMFATKDEIKLPVLVAKFLIFAGGAATTVVVGLVVNWIARGGLAT